MLSQLPEEVKNLYRDKPFRQFKAFFKDLLDRIAPELESQMQRIELV